MEKSCQRLNLCQAFIVHNHFLAVPACGFAAAGLPETASGKEKRTMIQTIAKLPQIKKSQDKSAIYNSRNLRTPPEIKQRSTKVSKGLTGNFK